MVTPSIGTRDCNDGVLIYPVGKSLLDCSHWGAGRWLKVETRDEGFQDGWSSWQGYLTSVTGV